MSERIRDALRNALYNIRILYFTALILLNHKKTSSIPPVCLPSTGTLSDNTQRRGVVKTTNDMMGPSNAWLLVFTHLRRHVLTWLARGSADWLPSNAMPSRIPRVRELKQSRRRGSATWGCRLLEGSRGERPSEGYPVDSGSPCRRRRPSPAAIPTCCTAGRATWSSWRARGSCEARPPHRRRR